MRFLIGFLERVSWAGLGIMVGAIAMTHFNFESVIALSSLFWVTTFTIQVYLSKKERKKRKRGLLSKEG